MQAKQDLEAECLRRLRAIQAITGHRRLDPVARGTLERVRDRHGGDRTWRFCERCDQGRDGARRDEWPSRVVDQHDVGRLGRERLEPGANAVLTR